MNQILKFRPFSLLFLLLIITNYLHAGIIGFKKQPDGILFTLDKGLMKINVCAPDIIEVKYTALNQFDKRASLVINKKWITPTFQIKESNSVVTITTSKMIIEVNKLTNAVSYFDKNHNLILSEDSQNGKTMEAHTVAGISTYDCSTRFLSPSDEGLYGLGCHPLDSLSINYKGRDQDMVIKYLTGAIPVLLSTKGYGILWDNYAASHFYGKEENNSAYRYTSESGKQVDYYFFYGPEFDRIINLYRQATGRAPLFPKWSFGLFQSQDRYKSQDEILTVKDNYRNQHIPVDAIVQDWFYWEPLPIGSHVMNPQRYPDPKSMIQQLHKAHLHAMISIWPVFGSGTNNFEALKKSGGLTSITWDNFVTKTFDTYYDAHNPNARNLYWKQASDSLVKRYGWDAWWVDQCEPDNGELLDERKKAIFYTGKGIDYFNTYSLEHSEGLYHNWRKDIPGKRAFFLIRQSFAGEQRNAATLWSSDITTTFSSFRNQIPQAINASVSGIPYWTSDIGGYLSHTSPGGVPDWSKPAYRELFIRWFQFGAFSPIFRIHGKGERALFSNNWDAATKSILLKYDKLRYRLLPYIYSLAAKVTTDHYTIMRSLAFDFRTDKNVYNIPDQYMFGPAFMVNPVTKQLFSNVTNGQVNATREIYLPPTTWYDFWTGGKIQGGKTIHADAALEKLPLYVKAGSIVPMGPNVEYATQKPADTIELRIYPGANGKFTLYEDENDNYNYEKGKSATIDFAWDDNLKQVSISSVKGNFPGMLTSRVFNFVLVKDGKGVGEQIEMNPDKTITYRGAAMKVALK